MTTTWILVSAAGRRQLVRLDEVREILAMMELDEVRERQGSCRGLANVRGEIIPVFDATAPDAPLTPSRFILVTASAEAPVGVVVDEIHDVLDLPDQVVSARPVGGGRTLTVARLGDDTVPVLEATRVVDAG